MLYEYEQRRIRRLTPGMRDRVAASATGRGLRFRVLQDVGNVYTACGISDRVWNVRQDAGNACARTWTARQDAPGCRKDVRGVGNVESAGNVDAMWVECGQGV